MLFGAPAVYAIVEDPNGIAVGLMGPIEPTDGVAAFSIVKNGVVLAYSNDISAGVIRSSDGRRLFFSKMNWKSDTPPSAGQLVTFKHAPDAALEVYFQSDPRTKIAGSPSGKNR